VEEHPGGDAILAHAGDDSTEGFFGYALIPFHALLICNEDINLSIFIICLLTLHFFFPKFAYKTFLPSLLVCTWINHVVSTCRVRFMLCMS